MGGTEGTLADGPMYLQVRPNYNISLFDPYFNEALTLGIKVAGVHLKNQTPNVEIAFNVISRAINIGLPRKTIKCKKAKIARNLGTPWHR